MRLLFINDFCYYKAIIDEILFELNRFPTKIKIYRFKLLFTFISCEDYFLHKQRCVTCTNLLDRGIPLI